MDIGTLRIETPRLTLRPTRWEDFEAWAAFLADEEATRLCMAGAWFLGRPAMFSVIEKSTGRWVGRLGPWTPEGWPGTEVGWGIARECWGRGYAKAPLKPLRARAIFVDRFGNEHRIGLLTFRAQ